MKSNKSVRIVRGHPKRGAVVRTAEEHRAAPRHGVRKVSENNVCTTGRRKLHNRVRTSWKKPMVARTEEAATPTRVRISYGR